MFPSTCSSKAMVVLMVVVMMTMMTGTDSAALQKTTKSHRNSSDVEKEKTVPLLLDLKALVPSRKVRALENASISPWTYDISNDKSLITHQLSEARCLLSGCLNHKGEEDQTLHSAPIKTEVLLLRKVMSKSGYVFRLESRVITVGCTCVRPIIQVQE